MDKDQSMKVLKPFTLGLLWRTYRREGYCLALSGLLAFRFSEPDVPVSEQDMWRSIAPLFPPDSAWDEGIPKDRGEVLVVGECRASGGLPSPYRQVALRIGPIAKTLDVFGDRFWTRERGILRRSDPRPFLSMPINYSRSFGGEGYGPNPMGKGFTDPQDASPRPLPNIEDPIRPLTSPDDRVDPAGFGPLGLTWEGRFKKIGKYRPNELGKEPPPLPADTDWTFFNQAPPDQWLSGMWNGGEEFALSGFCPEDAPQEGSIPRLRLRGFVTIRGGALEVALRPETLWLFPGISMGVLIHRGSLSIESDDASEVESILLGAEDPGEIRSMEYYLAVKARRESRNSRDVSRFSDAPLLPARMENDPRANLFGAGEAINIETGTPSSSSPPKWVTRKLDKIQENIDKVQESFLSQELPVGEEVPGDLKKLLLDRRAEMEAGQQKFKEIRQKLESPPSRSFEQLENFRKEKIDEVQKKLGDINVYKRQAIQKVEAEVNNMPPDLLEKVGKTRESLLDNLEPLKDSLDASQKKQAPAKLQPTIDELLKKDRVLSSLRAERDRLAASFPKDTPNASVFLEKIAKLDDSIESAGNMLDRMSATIPQLDISGIVRILHQYSPPPLDVARSAELREQVLGEITRGGGFKDRDLRGVDLSGLNLSGADFSEADLIGAKFSGAILSEAKFNGAWMAHADLSGSILDRANFSGAGLGCANLSRAQGSGVSFRDSFLTGALFVGCVLSDSDFSGADLFHVLFRCSKLHRSSFVKSKFLRMGTISFPPPESLPSSGEANPRFPIEDTDFTGSDFSKAVFLKVDLIRSVFSMCELHKATFLECTGPGTRFDGASLKKSTFPKSTDFSHSSFLKTDLSEASLRGLNLEASDFREAILVGMDGSEGIFRGANLSGTVAHKSRFHKSDLRFVNGRGSDFRQALFLKADLRGANFSRSSLYKAGFTGAKIDASTLWDHALTGKTTLSQERA